MGYFWYILGTVLLFVSLLIWAHHEDRKEYAEQCLKEKTADVCDKELDVLFDY